MIMVSFAKSPRINVSLYSWLWIMELQALKPEKICQGEYHWLLQEDPGSCSWLHSYSHFKNGGNMHCDHNNESLQLPSNTAAALRANDRNVHFYKGYRVVLYFAIHRNSRLRAGTPASFSGGRSSHSVRKPDILFEDLMVFLTHTTKIVPRVPATTLHIFTVNIAK